MLEALICEAREVYDRIAGESFVVKPAIPILYFGDSQAYRASKVKVITVALNPSRIEFPERDRFERFPAARDIEHSESDKAVTIIGRALDAYFGECPYRKWFDPSFEWLLNGLDVSYYGGKDGTALHTDIGSPVATDPTWSGLRDEQRSKLQADGVALWHRLVEVLQPDVMIASIARWHLDKIQFAPVSSWTPVWSRPAKQNGAISRPYHVEARRLRLASGKETLLVFGRAANQPFGVLSREHKRAIGRALQEVLHGR